MAGDAATGLSRGGGGEPGSGAPASGPVGAVAAALGGLPAEWTVLQDVRLADGRVRIDHVAIGPGGVFVIAAQRVAPAERGLARHAAGRPARPGSRDTMGRPATRAVRRVAAAARVLAAGLPGLGVKTVRPVLCLDTEAPVSAVRSGVLVCSVGNLRALLLTRSPLVTEQGVRQTTMQVLRQVDPAQAGSRWRLPGRWARALRTACQAAVVVGALATVLLVVANLPAIRDRMGAAFTSTRSAVGESASLPSTDAHPEVTVTVHRVVDVVAEDPGYDGRLLGVRLTVRNTGARLLSLHTGTDVVLRPELGRSWRAVPSRRPVAGGRRLLPTETVVPSGTRTSGWVVFEVPDRARFDQVSVRFGPTSDDVLRWSIDVDG